MHQQAIIWATANYLELLGALLGVVYVLFSIRQHLFTWPTGLATSLFYIAIFFREKFYADMALQFYYVVISIYGWVWWAKSNGGNVSLLKVSQSGENYLIKAFGISLLLWLGIYLILRYLTDSPVPIMDGLTTAMSITATYMLARKKLEHWLIWIVVNIISAGLYLYKELYPTTLLFLIYTAMAVVGYLAWKKELKNVEFEN